MTKAFVRTGLGAAALGILFLAAWLAYIIFTLPDISRLRNYRPALATEVFDRAGRLITQYHDRSIRFWVPVESLPEHVIWSVVIAEDDTFFEHQGVNYRAAWNAAVHDMKKGRFARGGSTITQQMIKNVLLTKEKTIGRKVREYFLSREAEEILTKRQILGIYLNEVEWGENLYGIEAASRFYFDKHASELTVAESSLLAGMLPNPRYFNPLKRMDKARDRQERVLSNMVQAKIITEDVFNEALRQAIVLRTGNSARFDLPAPGDAGKRPCYQRVLEERFLETYGEAGLYREGKKIRTTLDKDLQDRIRAQEETGEMNGNEVPGRILLVRDGAEIRAISCAEDEETVRSWIGAQGIGAAELGVDPIATGGLGADDLLPEAGSAHVSGDQR